MAEIHIVVLGARGSIPVSGPEYLVYGGNTTCFALVSDGRVAAFIDAGTGMAAYRTFGLTLMPAIDVFLTHYHLDHIQGLSMLDELWSGGCDVRLFGPGEPGPILERAISPPLFPVSVATDAALVCATMDGEVEVAGCRISSFPVNHPQSAIGYRIDGPNRSIAIITDHEAGTDIDDAILTAVTGVDLIIHDAQYVVDERESHRGWGHSTFEDAVALVRTADVPDLLLTSHDPRRTDEAMEAIVERVRTLHPATDAVRQGTEIAL